VLGAGSRGGAKAATTGWNGQPRRSGQRTRRGTALALGLGLASVALSAVAVTCIRGGTVKAGHPGQNARSATPPIPVVVAPAQVRDVGLYLKGLGTVTPVRVVTVRSRVDGQLLRVGFTEGETVGPGRLLAEIDPRPFEVQMAQAEGQLARDRALLQNARLDLRRYRALVEDEAVPRQQLDTQVALVAQYQGAVKTDQGLVASARLQLAYCRISAPIGGRLGLRLVDPGNIVHAADTGGLVVITALQPIAVVFSVPEDSVPQILARLEQRTAVPVDAFDREARRQLASGSLLTIDNQMDPTTGTVKLKAVFANADYRLFPSQFVNARLLLDVRRGATAVPAGAVQQSARGPFVFVVKPDGTATVRAIKTGVAEGEQITVDSGLRPGESVVVEGADRLHEGSRVIAQPRSGW
jgi:multidrug efflux system membrane fusion protein